MTFELDKDTVAILRNISGFENFNPSLKVLHCTKPGTGCKDSPRAWSIRLGLAKTSDFGLLPCTHDNQLSIRHTTRGELDCIATTHVDAIKVAAEMWILKELIAILEVHFGKGEVDVRWHAFKSCGLMHTPIQGGYTVDQTEYINALKPITQPDFPGLKNNVLAPVHLAKLFLSLVMALTFALQTRADLCIYVISLQRHLQKTQGRHIQRLNAVVRWAQANPKALTYRTLVDTLVLETHSDAGFKRELDADGHAEGKAVPGANYIRRGVQLQFGKAVKNPCHLIDWACGTIKQVTRSTFTSKVHHSSWRRI